MLFSAYLWKSSGLLESSTIPTRKVKLGELGAVENMVVVFPTWTQQEKGCGNVYVAVPLENMVFGNVYVDPSGKDYGNVYFAVLLENTVLVMSTLTHREKRMW